MDLETRKRHILVDRPPADPKLLAAMPTKLLIGTTKTKQALKRGRHFRPMVDSTALFKQGNGVALRQRLEADGYVLVRGAIPQQSAMAARSKLIQTLHEEDALELGKPKDQAFIKRLPGKRCAGFVPEWTVDAESGGSSRSADHNSSLWQATGNSPELTQVYNGAGLAKLYDMVFGSGYRTQPGCTWMRMRGRGGITKPHADYFYFKESTNLFRKKYRQSRDSYDGDKKDDSAADRRGHATGTCVTCGQTETNSSSLMLCTLCRAVHHCKCVGVPPLHQLRKGSNETTVIPEWHCDACADNPFAVYTCWISLGDIKYKQGTLFMKPGSQHLRGFNNPTRKTEPLLPHEYEHLKTNAWESAEMQVGDIILFNIKTVHAASRNCSDRYRISLDTRVVARSFESVQSMLSRGVSTETPPRLLLPLNSSNTPHPTKQATGVTSHFHQRKARHPHDKQRKKQQGNNTKPLVGGKHKLSGADATHTSKRVKAVT